LDTFLSAMSDLYGPTLSIPSWNNSNQAMLIITCPGYNYKFKWVATHFSHSNFSPNFPCMPSFIQVIVTVIKYICYRWKACESSLKEIDKRLQC
jgi:hypothetical protein